MTNLLFRENPGKLGKTFEPGQIIFAQGDPPDGLYVILEGEVEILIERANLPPYSLAILEQNDVLGEMAILENKPRIATARAVGHVRLLSIDQKKFLTWLQEDPLLALRIMDKMSARVRHLVERMVALLPSDSPANEI
ncbi:MAG: cyclic nucleotide-binding domain-containing protein [Magnetococcus sp. DMHC-6]